MIADEVLSSFSPENDKGLIIKGDDGNTLFQITTNKNDLDFLKNPNLLINNHQNISIIDLGECETILKRQYNISENDSLIPLFSKFLSMKSSLPLERSFILNFFMQN